MRAVSSPSGRAAELFAEANNWKAYVCVRSMPVLMSSLYLQLLEGRIPIGGVINFWSPWPGESCRRRWRSAYVFPLTEVGLYPPPMITRSERCRYLRALGFPPFLFAAAASDIYIYIGSARADICVNSCLGGFCSLPLS